MLGGAGAMSSPTKEGTYQSCSARPREPHKYAPCHWPSESERWRPIDLQAKYLSCAEVSRIPGEFPPYLLFGCECC
ncbi:hypothetical protein GN956_G14314 [Arapaima gigas]